MENWQTCEKECLEYLQKHFSSKKYTFEAQGGSDSTKSDILLLKNGLSIFYIESKMKQAQCGQFVAFPNKETRTFDYSNANAYPQNIQSEIILDKMSEDFDRYKSPSTDGIELIMDKSYFYSWIYEFYKAKGVKYFISEKNVGKNNITQDNFIIFPIEKFHKYFDVTSLYRRKKSGSANPNEKNYPEIITAANSEGFTISKIYKNDKYTFVEMNAAAMTYKITAISFTYQFKHVKDNIFKVTRLSNTANPNVIFSINLVQGQQESDLEKFKEEFN